MELKIDLKKRYKRLFAAKRAPELVDVPPLPYLMIDGQGAPEGQAFQDAVLALYSTAYTVKFLLKHAGRQDFVIPPLEGLWHSDDPSVFTEDRRDEWQWVLMVMQPEQVAQGDIAEALDALSKKRKRIPAHDRLRLETLEEGRAVQALHVGPYGEARATVDSLHAYARSEGYELVGKHHEVYLSDPRRIVPERLRTVLRQPVANCEDTPVCCA